MSKWIGSAVAAAALAMALYAGGTAAFAHGDGSTPAERYRSDQFVMVDGCLGQLRIYATPNGRYWIWRDGWTEARYRTSDNC